MARIFPIITIETNPKWPYEPRPWPVIPKQKPLGTHGGGQSEQAQLQRGVQATEGLHALHAAGSCIRFTLHGTARQGTAGHGRSWRVDELRWFFGGKIRLGVDHGRPIIAFGKLWTTLTVGIVIIHKNLENKQGSILPNRTKIFGLSHWTICWMCRVTKRFRRSLWIVFWGWLLFELGRKELHIFCNFRNTFRRLSSQNILGHSICAICLKPVENGYRILK